MLLSFPPKQKAPRCELPTEDQRASLRALIASLQDSGQVIDLLQVRIKYMRSLMCTIDEHVEEQCENLLAIFALKRALWRRGFPGTEFADAFDEATHVYALLNTCALRR